MPDILIVDNDDAIGELLVTAVSEHGHSSHCAPSVSAGLALLGQRKFDLAIIDVLLGPEDGRGLAARCVADGIPVILITGDPHALAEAEGSGWVVLGKPFRLQYLLSVIGDQLRASSGISGEADGTTRPLPC